MSRCIRIVKCAHVDARVGKKDGVSDLALTARPSMAYARVFCYSEELLTLLFNDDKRIQLSKSQGSTSDPVTSDLIPFTGRPGIVMNME